MKQTIGLAANDLSCQRGSRLIFKGLSFTLAPGEGLLVTGPNGAGKTSLLRQIAGLLPLADGELRLNGAGPDARLPELCHYIGHANAVKASLSIKENLAFWAHYLDGDATKLDRALAAFALAEIADLPAGLLSAGQKRRLALARLVAVPRVLWLLDEPAVGLDTASQEKLAGVMAAQLARGGLIIAATHVPLGMEPSARLDLGLRP